MLDVTPFSGASQRIKNETEPKEHKTCALSHTRLWEVIWAHGLEPHLVKMSAVPEATLSFNVIPIKIMVTDLRNRKKKTHNIHPPPEMTPNSKSVLEKQDRAGRSTFLFQTMSQRHRI